MKETLNHRPIHPWSGRLPELPEGKGEFYHWGPNYTVDPVVFAGGDRPSVLLILRKKDLQWALPGGFVDPEDTSDEAATRRELYEETRLELPETEAAVVYRGPVNDPRSTRNAWPETTALLWRIAERLPVQADDDAIDATWAPLDQLPEDLYGSHADIIRQAVIDHGSLREQLAYFDNRYEITPTTGGHMSYERHIISLPVGDRVFVKRHDVTAFTDELHDAHSRQYLEKEYAVYRQLAGQTTHIPRALELIGDHTLVIEACDPRDGWLWRAPRDPDLRDRYIREVLTALKEIETLSFNDGSSITPSHIAFHQDGWGVFQTNRDKITTLLSTHPSSIAQALLGSVDTLYQETIAHAPRQKAAFSHADLRQSNLAWHPTLGVKIVDWSWAGRSAPGLDTTSFLIDLAKSGIDIEPYREYFDPLHARKLIGFWLGRSVLPTREGSTVREHQLISALTAFELLASHQAVPSVVVPSR